MPEPAAGARGLAGAAPPPAPVPWRDLAWTGAEGAAVAAWARRVAADPYSPDHAAYETALDRVWPDVPAPLVRVAAAFAEGGPGALRVSGVAVPGDLAPTPAARDGADGLIVGTEPALLALARLLGGALSFPGMRRGRRVHNIHAVAEDAETQKASNAVRLDLHTEMAFQDDAPDALAILCLRAGSAPPATDLADLADAFAALDADSRARLAEPGYGFPGSYGADGAVQFARPLPAASATAAGALFRFDEAVRGAGPAHDAAFRAFAASAARRARGLVLAAGDLLLIDNRRIAHGRAAYAPAYGGGDRWLQRCLIRLRAAA